MPEKKYVDMKVRPETARRVEELFKTLFLTGNSERLAGYASWDLKLNMIVDRVEKRLVIVDRVGKK